MAETVKTRVRRRLRRTSRRAPATPYPPRPTWTRCPDEPPPGPDDLEGGAGVREPRRPYPSAPAGALALDEPRSELLDLVA
jgi:hypothetical protein